ncbi:MAG: putative DNA binding domain-containing protein [Deltaproteobacteria bacterium]|nr:putative DNA binding domain-containing protein [Deltaproteobacteria bacterium]
MSTLEQLGVWMVDREAEHLEFKEAKSSYNFDNLVKYCAALANEGGGHMVLGVTDRRPRRVVGSQAFLDLGAVCGRLLDKLRLRIEARELVHPDGRVLVFAVPSRPIGMPIAVDGAYHMRSGESLVSMTPDQLKKVFDEGVPDYSSAICPGATPTELSPVAVGRFHELVARRRADAKAHSQAQVLEDAELVVGKKVTNAALILLGTAQALRRHLPQGEVVFEYRHNDGEVAFAERAEYREGFLLFHDLLWSQISKRNTIYQYVDGLFRRDIPSFNERATREAILNAICHRDYRLQGSVFVRQFPTRLEILSPGGFPPGITPENILFRQSPRNRRLAEALSRCGLVERSGQGADLMFTAAVQEGKQPLDFAGSDAFQVQLTLHGSVQDEGFVRLVEHVAQESGRSLSTYELVVLEAVRHERKIPQAVQGSVAKLLDQGLIERTGKRRLVVARKYHRLVGRPADYTRRAGLERPTQKELLLKHLRDNPGTPLAELCEVLPNLTAKQVQTLLRELRAGGQVHCVGRTKGGRWYPGAIGSN